MVVGVLEEWNMCVNFLKSQLRYALHSTMIIFITRRFGQLPADSPATHPSYCHKNVWMYTIGVLVQYLIRDG